MDLQEFSQHCGEAKILAVSKLQPADKIRQLHAQGQKLFGENYVQEALDKIELLADIPDLEWHFIGHLQKNKAKQVVGHFSLIHSVDSLELAQVLDRQCVIKSLSQKILLQVNLAGEISKGGFSRQRVRELWPRLTELQNLRICGLMTMPPLTETEVEVRPYFRELRELLQELRPITDRKRHPLTELSMGTSHDYAVAVSEGATILRLGTILFGERPAKV